MSDYTEKKSNDGKRAANAVRGKSAPKAHLNAKSTVKPSTVTSRTSGTGSSPVKGSSAKPKHADQKTPSTSVAKPQTASASRQSVKAPTGTASSRQEKPRATAHGKRQDSGRASAAYNDKVKLETAAGENGNRARKGGRKNSKTADANRKGNAAVVAIIIVIIIILVGGGVAVWALNRDTKPAGFQDISYTETTELVLNPDVGFYRPAFVKLTETGVQANKPVYGDIALYHLRVDISAFSGAVNGKSDKAISQAALDGLGSVIEFYEERGRSVIVRFCYDPYYGGAANKEPSTEFMLDHIRSLSTVLDAHTDAITAIEAGMVGPWGEMHTSAAANADTINAIVGAFLSNVKDVPVLVRTPRMIYDYLGITIADIESYTVDQVSPARRLGLFNDGYLGSANDLGTYSDREKEVAFLSQLTEHLPYGGEVTVPGSSLHDIDKCLPEMFDMNLSYLNYEWNNIVVQDKWKNSTYTAACGGEKLYYGKSAYNYIANRMGYRLVVESSIFTAADGMLDIKLDIANVGFGNLNRTYSAVVVFVAEDGSEVRRAAGEYGGGDMNVSVALPETAGEYRVYAEFRRGEHYFLAFSNEGMYDTTLHANYIGKIIRN